MDRYYCSKFFVTLTVLLLGISYPLVLADSVFALSCSNEQINSPEVKSNLEQIKKNKLEQQLEMIHEWGKALYPLSDSEVDLRVQNTVFCSLIATLRDQTLELKARNNSAYVLRGIGTGAEDAIPTLKVLLLDRKQYPEMRISAVWAIRGIGASPVVNELVQVLGDKNDNDAVRSLAAETLLSFPNKKVPRDAGAVSVLSQILQQDPNSNMRSSAAKTLGQVAPVDVSLVAQLNQALKDSSWVVRKEAANALGVIAANTDEVTLRNSLKETVPNLLTALDDKNYTLRSFAISALGQIGASDSETLNRLSETLRSDPNVLVKGEAAGTIGKLLAKKETFKLKPDKEAFNSLISFLKEQQPNTADQAIATVAKGLPGKVKDGQLDVDEAIIALNTALTEMKKNQSLYQETVHEVEDQKWILERIKAKQVIVNIIKNPYLWAAILIFGSYGGIFLMRPLWLLKIDEGLLVLEAVPEVKSPTMSGVISAVVVLLRFLSPLKYNSRVLDAWVLAHIKSVRDAFQAKDTVQERQVHVPSPVIVNERTTIAQLTGKEMQKHFAKQKHLLIWGEGGSGKTSLACQIAKWAMSDDESERLCKHRMLPVLIEEDINSEPTQGKHPFTNAILGQLNDELEEDTEPVSEKLVEQLLLKQRILVIVDHLSEMSAETRHLIRPEMSDCSAKALMVTSRIRETLGRVVKTTIQPLRIEGNHLSSFMEAYLREQGKRDLFTDSEFFEACSRLSRIVDRGNITVLLAKLYTEQLIAFKVRAVKASPMSLPDNVPDLMLSYLNELNRDVHEDKLDDRVIQRAAKTIAWECLKATYEPTTAMRQDIVVALGEDKAEIQLEYMEKRLHLIQTIGPAKDRIRFTIDPISEYLAALHLLDLHHENDSQWSELLKQLDTIPEGFLSALRDCCYIEGRDAKVPNFIIDKLSQCGEKTTNLSKGLREVSQSY